MGQIENLYPQMVSTRSMIFDSIDQPTSEVYHPIIYSCFLAACSLLMMAIQAPNAMPILIPIGMFPIATPRAVPIPIPTAIPDPS